MLSTQRYQAQTDEKHRKLTATIFMETPKSFDDESSFWMIHFPKEYNVPGLGTKTKIENIPEHFN